MVSKPNNTAQQNTRQMPDNFVKYVQNVANSLNQVLANNCETSVSPSKITINSTNMEISVNTALNSMPNFRSSATVSNIPITNRDMSTVLKRNNKLSNTSNNQVPRTDWEIKIVYDIVQGEKKLS